MLSARILENPEPDVLSARHASASRIDDHHEDRHLCCGFSAQLMLQQQPNRLLKKPQQQPKSHNHSHTEMG